MEIKVNMGNFKDLEGSEMMEIDGGLLGATWLTWTLLGKVFAGGVTLGAAGATAYLATK